MSLSMGLRSGIHSIPHKMTISGFTYRFKKKKTNNSTLKWNKNTRVHNPLLISWTNIPKHLYHDRQWEKITTSYFSKTCRTSQRTWSICQQQQKRCVPVWLGQPSCDRFHWFWKRNSPKPWIDLGNRTLHSTQLMMLKYHQMQHNGPAPLEKWFPGVPKIVLCHQSSRNTLSILLSSAWKWCARRHRPTRYHHTWTEQSPCYHLLVQCEYWKCELTSAVNPLFCHGYSGYPRSPSSHQMRDQLHVANGLTHDLFMSPQSSCDAVKYWHRSLKPPMNCKPLKIIGTYG